MPGKEVEQQWSMPQTNQTHRNKLKNKWKWRRVNAVGSKSNTVLNTGLRLIENSQSRAALTFCLTLLWLVQSKRRGSARKERNKQLLHLPVCLLLFFLLSLCSVTFICSFVNDLFSLWQPTAISLPHADLSLVSLIFSLPVFRWIRLQENVWMLEQLRPQAWAAWKQRRFLLQCGMTAGLDSPGLTLITTCR